MSDIDKRDRLKDNPFSFKVTQSGKVFIYWQNRQIIILSEKESGRFLSRINGKSEFEQQLELAKVTGHFKHGNEKKG